GLGLGGRLRLRLGGRGRQLGGGAAARGEGERGGDEGHAAQPANEGQTRERGRFIPHARGSWLHRGRATTDAVCEIRSRRQDRIETYPGAHGDVPRALHGGTVPETVATVPSSDQELGGGTLSVRQAMMRRRSRAARFVDAVGRW